MFDVLKSGGLLMIPILLCGLIGTFIIVERLIFFISLSKKNKLFRQKINPLINKKAYAEAVEACKDETIPQASVIVKVIAYQSAPAELRKDAISAEIDRQIPSLERFLVPLATIANISTLLGLLGTVTGNIGAFGVLGEGASMGNPALLASSIAEALVTTASGLVVSIPALIFHNFFVSKVDKTILELESISTDLLLRLSKKEATK